MGRASVAPRPLLRWTPGLIGDLHQTSYRCAERHIIDTLSSSTNQRFSEVEMGRELEWYSSNRPSTLSMWRVCDNSMIPFSSLELCSYSIPVHHVRSSRCLVGSVLVGASTTIFPTLLVPPKMILSTWRMTAPNESPSTSYRNVCTSPTDSARSKSSQVLML